MLKFEEEKPSWDDAPEWANFQAYDYSEELWFWFEKRPKLIGTDWYGGGKTIAHRKYAELMKTLEKRP